MKYLLSLTLCLTVSFAEAADWKTRAKLYKRSLIREARVEYGLKAPIAMFAGQIHQESLWRPLAQSKYARGLTQFTPGTEKWIKRLYKKSLGNGGWRNPQWAIRALVKYDKYLYKRVKAVDSCNRWAFALAAYNGGLGWIRRDKKLAKKKGKNPQVWWGSVEFHSRRAKWAIKENRHYPVTIIYKNQRHYKSWGPSVCQ